MAEGLKRTIQLDKKAFRRRSRDTLLTVEGNDRCSRKTFQMPAPSGDIGRRQGTDSVRVYNCDRGSPEVLEELHSQQIHTRAHAQSIACHRMTVMR